MPTDTIAVGNGGGVRIEVAGTVDLQTWPWMIGSSYSIIGKGYSGGLLNGMGFPTTLIDSWASSRQPVSSFEVMATTSKISTSTTSLGHAMMLTTDPATAQSAVDFQGKESQLTAEQDGSSTGVPLMIDGNTIFAYFENMDFTRDQWVSCFGKVHEHALRRRDSCGHNLQQHYDPVARFCRGFTGGKLSQGLTSFEVQGYWSSEEHGQYTTGGMIGIDTGTAGGTPGVGVSPSGHIGGVYIENMHDNADASNRYLTSYLGSVSNTGTIYLNNSDTFITQPLCLNGSPNCVNGNTFTVITRTPQYPNRSFFVGPVANQQYLMHNGLLFTNPAYAPTYPDFAHEIPAPTYLSVSGTGSGSLSAGTYCFIVVGEDSQSIPGLTMPTPEVCQTVGASASISLFWQLARDNMNPEFRIYFGSSGAENNYFRQAAANSTNQTFTLTTTAGETSGTPPSPNATGTAYSDWISDERASCLRCVPNNAANPTGGGPVWQLGIGEPSPPSGDELAVKGGVLDAESGFKSALATKSANYTLTTSDNWVNVTGTTTITVPHASTGNHWVVFNSGSNTVTVQADSGNINGGANITLSANTGKEIVCDGTNCFAH